MRSNASKIKQLQHDNFGYATIMVNPIGPYVLIAATKIDVVRIIASLEKIKQEDVNTKKIHRVKIVKFKTSKRKHDTMIKAVDKMIQGAKRRAK